jgi:uncharacterized protein
VNLQPLTDAELDKLADVLKRFGDKRAMNLEMLDGFFAALICDLDDVPPSESSRKFGEATWSTSRRSRPSQFCRSLFRLVTRHWNATCDALQSGNVFSPLLLDDESGVARANDWANGFMRGMEMRRGSVDLLGGGGSRRSGAATIVDESEMHRPF